MKITKLFLLIILIANFIFTHKTLNDIIPVKATQLYTTEYTPYLTVNGEFETTGKTTVTLSYPVCIDKIYVEENRYVNCGQPLFSLDMEKMRSVADRNFDADLFNGLDYSVLTDLQEQNKSIDLSSVSNVIYAGTDGYIENINISEGSIALNNSDLLTISPNSDIVARFSLSQQDFGKVKVGDNVSISSVAFSKIKYNGKITDKSAVVKKQNNLSGSKVVVDVFAHIENPDSRVSNGLQITGIIQNGPIQTLKVIDYNYINQDETGEFVYVFDKGKAKKQYIETGIESDSYTQILTAFPEGTIFLYGEIADGSRVLLSE